MRAKLVLIGGGPLLIYELSDPIFKGTSDSLEEVNIRESINELYDKLDPYYKTDAEIYRKDGCYYVVILLGYGRKHVFPAIKIRDNEYRFNCDEIVGKQAKIDDGQVPVNVQPDEAYLQYLATINRLSFEGIEEMQIGTIFFDLDGRHVW